ncbi:MAG TPA: menaquinone biosynthesis protein [Chitinophagaceae bacterium]|nr:menaquinone biosynthesis protein [Chitinophagaceae bacterium]
MQKRLRVGAVSYLNTKPLIYGFEQGQMKEEVELILDVPSNLATRMQKDQLDIALLPVASIPNIPDAEVFSRYCIASEHQVASVALFSQVPIEEIQEVYLDDQSKTSVALFRILMRDYWHIRPSLLEATEPYIEKIQGKTAGIIIGDRALEQRKHFPYVYDLAEAWNSHTRLPFVFATWVSNKALSASFIKKFEAANATGFRHLDEIIAAHPFPAYDLGTYYRENISYELHEENRNGMQLFLKTLDKL